MDYFLWAQRRDRYATLRDHAMFNLAHHLETGRISFRGLRRDDPLRNQLLAINYGYHSDGRQKVESKDEMAARGVPSPDRADALALAFWRQPAASSVAVEPTDVGTRLLIRNNAAWRNPPQS